MDLVNNKPLPNALYANWTQVKVDPVQYRDQDRRGLTFLFGMIRKAQNNIIDSPINKKVAVYQKSNEDGDYVIVSMSGNNPNDIRIFEITNDYIQGDVAPDVDQTLVSKVMEMADATGMQRKTSEYGEYGLIETADAGAPTNQLAVVPPKDVATVSKKKKDVAVKDNKSTAIDATATPSQLTSQKRDEVFNEKVGNDVPPEKTDSLVVSHLDRLRATAKPGILSALGNIATNLAVQLAGSAPGSQVNPTGAVNRGINKTQRTRGKIAGAIATEENRQARLGESRSFQENRWNEHQKYYAKTAAQKRAFQAEQEKKSQEAKLTEVTTKESMRTERAVKVEQTKGEEKRKTATHVFETIKKQPTYPGAKFSSPAKSTPAKTVNAKSTPVKTLPNAKQKQITAAPQKKMVTQTKVTRPKK